MFKFGVLMQEVAGSSPAVGNVFKLTGVGDDIRALLEQASVDRLWWRRWQSTR